MKVYVDIADSGKTVTYKEEYGKRQYLYVHDNEGFIFKDLADYTKQVRKEVLADLKEKYKQKMANALGDDEEIGHMNCDDVLEELLEEIGFDEVLELYRSQGKWYA